MRLKNERNELEKALIVKGYSFNRGTNRKTLKFEKQILQQAQLESCSLDPSTTSTCVYNLQRCHFVKYLQLLSTAVCIAHVLAVTQLANLSRLVKSTSQTN